MARKYEKHDFLGEYPPEYWVWKSMIDRCHNPKNRSYSNYGKRGIQVCKQWRESFNSFYGTIGPRPSDDHQIDRIDNDGHYTPTNVRWATRIENARNKTIPVQSIIYMNQTKTLVDWAEEIGLDPKVLRARIKKGWSLDRAMVSKKRDYGKLIEHNGKKQLLKDWIKELGLSKSVVYRRIKAGYPIHVVLSKQRIPLKRKKK